MRTSASVLWLIGVVVGLMLGVGVRGDAGAHGADARGGGDGGVGVEVVFERYYALEMNGERAGWMVERRTRDASGLTESASEVRMTLARLGQALETRLVMSFVEADAAGGEAGAGGEPVSMRFVMGDGSSSREVSYVWEDGGGVTVVDRDVDSGRVTRRVGGAVEGVPAGGAARGVGGAGAEGGRGWFTPLEAERYVRSRRAAGAGAVSYWTVSPDTGLVAVRLTDRVLGDGGTVEVMGRAVAVEVVETTTSAVPGLVTRQRVDGDGVAVETVTPLGGVELVARLVGAEEALADFAPPEFMASSFVVPSGVEGGVIDRPRAVRRAVYVLRAADGVLEDLPSAGGQVFERIDAGTGRVTVGVDDRVAVAGGVDLERYRAATAMADSGDAEVVRFAALATAGVESWDVEAVAEALRLGVYRHIGDKSLAAGFASASDAVRDRVGDCTEHACLMVAAARARGLAARSVTGLIYADFFGARGGGEGAFAYHMWVQVWVPEVGGDGGGEGGGAWVDFDPSWPGRFDGVHIALGTGDLSDGGFLEAAARSARFIGNLGIAVESVSYGE